jgi:hypothetical protein
MKKVLWIAPLSLLSASQASSQQLTDSLLQSPQSLGEGWAGFSDIGFLVDIFLKLTLAAMLGAIVAYHPKHEQTADTLEEIEAPKVYIMYAVIGALIGIMVVKYGLVVGFVLFGIGGLIRFRTALRSARLTGQVMFVTLIGLSCGLDLPHVAVLATLFGFVLIYIFDARATYRIEIKALPVARIGESADAYRTLLEQQGFRIISERKNPAKEKVTMIFKTSRHITREQLQDLFQTRIDAPLKGTVDWEID